MLELGNRTEDSVIDFKWESNNGSGAAITRATNGTISVYKGNSDVQSVAGVADTEDFDSTTGIHHVRVDTSADAFYEVGYDYQVVLTGATIDGQTVNAVLASFRIEYGFQEVDVVKWLGTAVATPTVAGVPEMDVTHWLGTACSTPTTPGVPEVDVVDWGGSGAAMQKSMIGGIPQVDALTLKDEAPDTLVFEEIRDNLDILTTTATGSPTTTTVQLVDGSTQDDFYNDQLLYISTGTGTGQSKPILSYAGATKTVTVAEPFIVAPASGDGISIRVDHVHPIAQIQDGLAVPGDAMALTSSERTTLAGVVWTVGNMAATAMNRISDFVLRRLFVSAAENADDALGSETGRNLMNASRKHRNKKAISGDDLIIYKENDTTEAWRETLTTDANADPIVGADPTD